MTKEQGPCPPELYDPTIKTSVDDVQATIADPGRLIEQSGNTTSAFELDRMLILAGSDPAADIEVKSDGGADYIAEISYEGGLYFLRRLDDRAEITVCGKPVTEHILAEGDEIRLADRTFVYRDPDPAHRSRE